MVPIFLTTKVNHSISLKLFSIEDMLCMWQVSLQCFLFLHFSIITLFSNLQILKATYSQRMCQQIVMISIHLSHSYITQNSHICMYIYIHTCMHAQDTYYIGYIKACQYSQYPLVANGLTDAVNEPSYQLHIFITYSYTCRCSRLYYCTSISEDH